MYITKKIKELNSFLIFIIYFTASFQLNAVKLPTEHVSEVGLQQLEAATLQAIQTRRLSEIDRLSKERGSSEEEELAHRITADVTDYTAGETHESSIKNFIEKNFGIVSNNLFCVAPERIKTREFVFIDKENGLVVKIFPQIPKHFFKIIHELSGHQAFESLHLKSMELVSFLALGKYKHNGIDYLLLAMSYAKGEEIRKWVENIYTAQDFTAKQEAIHSAKDILRKLGSALGDLHLLSAIKMSPPEGYIEAVSFNRHNEAQKNLNEYQERGGLHRDVLKLYFEQLLSQYSFEEGFFSIFHGDAHLANFLYDKEKDSITVIDSVKAHLSVDPNGLPISDNFMHDCVKVEEAIAKQILRYEANEELIQELINAFHQGYDKKAAAIINPSSYAVDRCSYLLKRLASSLKPDEDPRNQEYRQRTFEHYENILIKESQHALEASFH